MKKTDKKIENAVIDVLTEACDVAQQASAGFMWLTHFVNYSSFPDSLSVVCVYDTNENLARADKESMRALIKEKLAAIGVQMKEARKQVSFDTEEQCQLEHDGKWQKRFN